MTKQYDGPGDNYMNAAYNEGENCSHCGLQTHIIIDTQKLVLTWCKGCGSILMTRPSSSYSVIMTPYISVDADKHQPSEQ